VLCTDTASGEEFEIEADNVINATGVWADRIRPDEIHEEADVPRIAPSRGTHITLDPAKLDLGAAACIVPAGEERRIFALPWYGRPLIGTTDNDFDGDISHPHPSEDDIAYLLDAVNSFFGVSLGEADISGAYAGVRPLISTGDPRKSVDISRKAELYETSSGLLTITGGKLTTWRRMAKQVVDRMVERAGREAPCKTAEIPLGMAADDDDLAAPDGLDEAGLPEGYGELLRFRYGHAARKVLRIAAERPELAGPIVAGEPDLLAEAALAARLEQATSIADVLLRRTRLGLLAAPKLRGADSVMPVAEVLGAELGWDSQRVRAEAERWSEDAASEGIDPAIGVTSVQ
jgi:glycerol-3-phosphate dehydrogenase